MRLFKRRQDGSTRSNDKTDSSGPEVGAKIEVTEADPPQISVARTLVKSEPELVELVAREPRLKDERIDVSLTEKGFGTRVAIVAEAGKGLEEADLEAFIDQLAEPQKRPFSTA